MVAAFIHIDDVITEAHGGRVYAPSPRASDRFGARLCTAFQHLNPWRSRYSGFVLPGPLPPCTGGSRPHKIR